MDLVSAFGRPCRRTPKGNSAIPAGRLATVQAAAVAEQLAIHAARRAPAHRAPTYARSPLARFRFPRATSVASASSFGAQKRRNAFSHWSISRSGAADTA